MSTPVSTLEGMPVSHHLPLGPGAEFDAVRAMLDVWGAQARGIGDDGALLDVPPGTRLVVSTDTSVEDVHFRRAWMTPEEIGYRAAMAALSDLAAMGAAPLGLLVAAAGMSPPGIGSRSASRCSAPPRGRSPVGARVPGIDSS